MYIDSRLHLAIDLRFDKPFFDRGDFPQVITNGTEQIVLQNPWKYRPNSAPFDQPFYLILNVAVGGTNGWFPDGAGNKPWLDGSLSMYTSRYYRVALTHSLYSGYARLLQQGGRMAAHLGIHRGPLIDCVSAVSAIANSPPPFNSHFCSDSVKMWQACG
jgi:hypothetical protein